MTVRRNGRLFGWKVGEMVVCFIRKIVVSTACVIRFPINRPNRNSVMKAN